MKRLVVAAVVVFCSFLPAWCQQGADAATREDVEQMLQVTGSREMMQQVWAGITQQAATIAADNFRHQHPDATPLQQEKAAEAAAEMMKSTLHILSIDEIIQALIPVYQRHLSHSDMQTIIEFYSSPTGQKMVKEMPQMMTESIRASTAILQKHMPELEAEASKAANETLKNADKQ